MRGTLPFLHIRRACCCLAAESSPRSVRSGELGWKVDNVPVRALKTERLIPTPHPYLASLLPGGKEPFCKSLPFWSWHKAHNWDVKYTSVLNYNRRRPDRTYGGITGLTKGLNSTPSLFGKDKGRSLSKCAKGVLRVSRDQDRNTCEHQWPLNPAPITPPGRAETSEWL